jgi:hypothetical protein
VRFDYGTTTYYVRPMRSLLVTLTLVASLVACGKKKDNAGTGTASASGSAVVEQPLPTSCPAGNVVQDGKCIPAVTPATVAVVQTQQTRIDDLAKLLDQVELVAAPVELLDGFRQLPQWKALADKSAKLKVADTVVATLNEAVKKLRELKGHLGEASQRLGNLKGELDKLLNDPTVVRKIEDVRTTVSTELRAAIEPLAQNVKDTIQNALTPLATQLNDMADLVIGACAMAKLSGGGDKMKEMCESAKVVFEKGRTFVDDFKTKPATLFTDISTKLETELDQLLDAAAKQAVDTAQQAVNDALNLPPGGTGSGSSGSGSAAPTGSAAPAGSAAGSAAPAP